MNDKKCHSLSLKHQRFADEYLIDLNAARAYKKIYKCSSSVADPSSSRLLKNVRVAAYIAEKQEKLTKKCDITKENVLKEIAKISFSDVRKLFNEDGQLLPIKDLPDEVAACISSIEVVTSKIPGSDPVEVEYTAKIKMWDKTKSLELAGKHLKLFTEKVELGGSITTRLVKVNYGPAVKPKPTGDE